MRIDIFVRYGGFVVPRWTNLFLIELAFFEFLIRTEEKSKLIIRIRFGRKIFEKRW